MKLGLRIAQEKNVNESVLRIKMCTVEKFTAHKKSHTVLITEIKEKRTAHAKVVFHNMRNIHTNISLFC